MRDNPVAADPLGEALHFLHLVGRFYCRSELTAPWGMALHPMPDHLWFHVVTSGQCLLEVGQETMTLRTGELALVPHGEGHVLRSAAGVPAPRIDRLHHDYESDRYAILRHGGGGTPATLVCGAVRIEHPAARHLVDLLPRIVHLEPGEGLREDWMHSTLRLLAAEARELRPGGETVITRLSDLLVIQAIRTWIDNAPAAGTGWLGALRDPVVGRAITLIHQDPARPWTVAALADELAMSRSAFAARFTELVDEPAMRYVTRWRMYLAREWLREDGATVAALAARLGYQSEAAFSRAFKRVVGISPGAARRVAPAG
ncbi:AraC family transcriptional regulator [Actinophytocola xanthii]|uniref:AraC family transcriptional regulator n=1 Tax=Actinophytocola xanthii TaxID=1912961 RepID=UPI0018E9479E|nr:AraC family transcriptional regulator [Actinophytocola xanthii]